MTLALAWKCSDGAILAADSEVTLWGRGKYPGKKIYEFSKLKCHPYFAIAGLVSFCKASLYRLVKALEKAEQNADADLPAVLRNEIKEIHREHSGMTVGGEPLELSLLIVMRYPAAKLAVFKVDGPVLMPVAENDVECIGIGDTAAQSVIARLRQQGDSLTTSQADRAVIYTLAEAKQFAPYVGGRAEIFFLREDDATSSGGMPVTPDTEEVFSDFLAAFNKAARPILLNYNLIEDDAIVFEAHLERFNKEITTFRANQIQAWKQEFDRHHKEVPFAKGIFAVDDDSDVY